MNRMLSTALFSLGVFAVAPTIEAQPKAAPAAKAAAEVKLTPPYTEVVKYEPWQALDKRFGRPMESVWAWRKTINGEEGIYIRTRDAAGGIPPIGSRITDKDGAAWLVTKSQRVVPDYLCYVKKIEPAAEPKKAPAKKAGAK